MNRFRDAVRKERFAILAELTVQRESTASDIRRQADLLAPRTDGVQVTDNPYAWVQMSSLALSAILLEHGVDAVPIVSCRDRNRRALRADLLGMQGLGVSSVMLMRGHRVPKNHSVPASTVFDLTGRELISLAAALEPAGVERLFIGTGARAFRPNRGWRAESLNARIAAGAGFVQTQLCFNMDILRHYMRRVVAAGLTGKITVMVSLSPLPSAETARWVKENMGDARIPAAVIQRLQEATDPRQEGIRICAELMQEISEVPGVGGVCLLTTGDAEAVAEAIQLSGMRS